MIFCLLLFLYSPPPLETSRLCQCQMKLMDHLSVSQEFIRRRPRRHKNLNIPQLNLNNGKQQRPIGFYQRQNQFQFYLEDNNNNKKQTISSSSSSSFSTIIKRNKFNECTTHNVVVLLRNKSTRIIISTLQSAQISAVNSVRKEEEDQQQKQKQQQTVK